MISNQEQLKAHNDELLERLGKAIRLLNSAESLNDRLVDALSDLVRILGPDCTHTWCPQCRSSSRARNLLAELEAKRG